MLLEQVQIIHDREEAKFAVIPFEEYVFLRELLADDDKLVDYFDYMALKRAKAQTTQRFSLAEVKRELLESK